MLGLRKNTCDTSELCDISCKTVEEESDLFRSLFPPFFCHDHERDYRYLPLTN